MLLSSASNNMSTNNNTPRSRNNRRAARNLLCFVALLLFLGITLYFAVLIQQQATATTEKDSSSSAAVIIVAQTDDRNNNNNNDAATCTVAVQEAACPVGTTACCSRRVVDNLLSNSSAFLVDDDEQKQQNANGVPSSVRSRSAIDIRAVVADLRSYTYLTEERYLDSSQGSGVVDDDESMVLRVPSPGVVAACPFYDDYMWGLANTVVDDGNHHTKGRIITVPSYVTNAVAAAGGTRESLIRRYGKRNVLYLQGDRDTIPLDNNNTGSSNNHGYNEDSIQGKHRLERSELYFRSLQELYRRQDENDGILNGEQETTAEQQRDNGNNDDFTKKPSSSFVHRRWLVKGVDHDHGLVFHSPEGIEAVFDPNVF